MRKILIISFVSLVCVFLTACVKGDGRMSDQKKAEEFAKKNAT